MKLTFILYHHALMYTFFVFWNSFNLFFETVNTENKSQSDSEVTAGGKGGVGRPGGDSPVPGGGPESGGP